MGLGGLWFLITPITLVLTWLVSPRVNFVRLFSNGNRYLNFRSDHPLEHKQSVVRSLIDFGNNWGERAWDRISGQTCTSFGKKISFFISGETCVSGDPLEVQSGIVGEGGGKGPNIP